MKRLSVIWLGLVIAAPCWGISCLEAWAQLRQYFQNLPEGDDYAKHGRPTVRALPHLAKEGRHGGKIIPVYRIGNKWGSNHMPFANAFQGDPRHFVQVFGTEASAFFGFQILSDTEMRIPDFKEFKGAIRKLNEELKKTGEEPIAIDFFAVKNEAGASRYVREMANNGRIPMAVEGTSQFHDLAFHSHAIYLPKDLVEHAKRQTQVVLDFTNYLHKVANGEMPNPTRATPETIRRAIQVLQMERLAELDVLTANLATMAAIDITDPSGAARNREQIEKEMEKLYPNQKTRIDFLAHFLTQTRNDPEPDMFRSWATRWWFLKFPISKSTLQNYVESVEPLGRAYLATPQGKAPLGTSYTTTADELCQQMRHRRVAIAKAAARLNGQTQNEPDAKMQLEGARD